MHHNNYKTLKKLQSQQSNGKDYKVSLAVRVMNEENGLKFFWESVNKQTCFDELEITFLDSGSTDGTLLYLKKLNCNIYTIDNSEFTYGDSCNLMMDLTTQEYVYFFSGHVILANTCLISDSYKAIVGNNISCYFRQIPNKIMGASIYDDAFLKFRFPYSKSPIQIIRKNSFSNAASVINRIHWKKIKFENVIFGEDEIWANKLLETGEKIYYFGNLNVMHSHNDGYEDVYKRVSKAAVVKYPTGISLKQAFFIFFKVWGAVFLNSGKFLKSVNYACAHTKAYIQIKKH